MNSLNVVKSCESIAENDMFQQSASSGGGGE